MTAFYNEIEPYAAAWLRNLIAAGEIPDGVVDERDIRDIRPSELARYTQCHFFAGIGGWARALRLAGWPDDRPVWTGSCPCQPFSSAGKRKGADDERHLWPVFFRLIRACRPPVIFGEQVASADVIGRAEGNPYHLQGVRVREALRSVSDDWEAEVSGHLPRLPERAGAKAEASEPDAHGRAEEGVEAGEPGLGAGLFGALPMPGEGPAVRSDGGGHPETDRRWPVRDDGHPVRSGWRLERAVAGQDEPGGRLHDEQRPGGARRAQRDDEPLGRAEGAGDRGRAAAEAGSDSALERLLGALSGEAEGTNGPTWLDLVQADLEGAGYAFGASDMCAAGVGAPHIRQRLWWVADALHAGRPEWRPEPGDGSTAGSGGLVALGHHHHQGLPARERAAVGGAGRGQEGRATEQSGGASGALADADRRQRGRLADGKGRERDGQAARWVEGDGEPAASGKLRGLADADGGHASAEREQRSRQQRQQPEDCGSVPDRRTGPVNGFWADADWLLCRDGKWRPTKPGIFPLSHGVSGRMVVRRTVQQGGATVQEDHWYNRIGALRAAGNAIVPQVAAEFIGAYLDTKGK